MEPITLFNRQITPEYLRYGIAGLCVLLLGTNLMGEPSQLWEQYSQLRAEVNSKEAILEQKRLLVGTEAQILAKKQKLDQALVLERSYYIPHSQMLSILLIDLAKLFNSANVTLVSLDPGQFTPLQITTMSDLGRMSLQITAQGTYPSFIQLFDQLSRYQRPISIESPRLVPTSGQSASAGGGKVSIEDPLNSKLSVTFTLNTYALSQ